MDIINSIASWSGWAPLVPILVFIGIVGAWLYEKRIELLKEENESVNRKLQEYINYAPDVLAKRLSERHKILSDEIEILVQDKEHNVEKISQLEQELTETKNKAISMREQLEGVQEILMDLEQPRSGKVKPNIAIDILKTVEKQDAIYFLVEIIHEPNDEFLNHLKTSKPFRIEVENPGMSKMYVNVYDSENSWIGRVFNPYIEVYYKDYNETLLEILRLVTSKQSPLNADYHLGSFILYASEYHSTSPIDPSIIYIKVPFNVIMLEHLNIAG